MTGDDLSRQPAGRLARLGERLNPRGQAEAPDEELKQLATRLAQGAVVISTVLAFFGVKDGQLDRLLRNEPRDALLFFGLAGLGIVLGLSVLAFKSVSRGRVALVLLCLVVAPLALAASISLRTQGATTTSESLQVVALFLVALIGTAVVAWLAVRRWRTTRRLRVAVILGTLVTAGLAYGATSLRDHHNVSWRAVAVASLLVLAFAAGVLLLAAVAWSVTGQALLLIAGSAVFLTSIAGLSVLAVHSKSAKDRPRVEAELIRSDGAWVLKGRVSARGLTSREHLLIAIEGMNFLVPLEGRRTGRLADPVQADRARGEKPFENDFFQTVLLLRVGPDADGQVDVPITAPISFGVYDRVRVAARLETEASERALHQESQLYEQLFRAQDELAAGQESSPEIDDVEKALDELHNRYPELLDDSRCSLELRERSCLTIALPQPAVRPSLALAPAPSAGTVTLNVKASDLGADDVVEVQLSVEEKIVYRSRMSSGASGNIDDTASIAVGTKPAHVCAMGRILRGPALAETDQQEGFMPADCPPAAAWALAWSELYLN